MLQNPVWKAFGYELKLSTDFLLISFICVFLINNFDL